MFRFAHPEYLNALYLIPVLILLYFYLQKKRKKLLQKFADSKLHSILLPTYSGFKSAFKFGLFCFALILLILSAANPQVGVKVEEVKQTGIDVFVLLDVSASMMAEDVKPSRLDKAKYQISTLVRRLRGDRIGLIIFSGDAYVQFPLTTDYSAANLFLNAVDVNSVPQQGTAIGPAISLALKSFDPESATEKAVVIITDGEDHEGELMASVEEAAKNNILIYTIGLGSPQGAPIPVYKNGMQSGYKQDREGNIVLTKLDESTLQKIAAAGNGRYYRGSNYEDQLEMIYKDLSSLEKTEFGVKKVTDYEDRFYYLLIPAILMLIIEFFMSEKKSVLYAKLNKRLGIEI